MLIDYIRRTCPSFDHALVSEAIEVAGGESLVCEKHLKLMLSLHPDIETFLMYIVHVPVLEGKLELQTVQEKFGVELAERTAHLNSILTLPVSKKTQSEVLRKMFLTLARDFRTVMVLLIYKLSELDHLYESLDPQLKEKCEIAMEIYIPIATRLGIYELKTQMEEVCFAVLYPEDYKRVKAELKPFEDLSEEYIRKVTEELTSLLVSSRINVGEVSGRMKHPYSIYKKMCKKQKQNVSDIFDIFAFRIILKDVYFPDGTEDLGNCYAVLGLVHSKWKPIARRFKDYIAVPKVNGYRSLHTTVLGLTTALRNEPAEIQIRTESMHHEAEFGIAAHWWYKESKKMTTVSKDSARTEDDPRIKNQLEWLKGLADLHQSMDDVSEAGTHENKENSDGETSGTIGKELELFADQIFVLTPDGDVKDLPLGATPIDFAYTVHTEVGNSCIQAKVNGNIVPLDAQLHNGDVVQIVTKKGSTPNRYWLSFAKTHAAQYRIKNYFRMQDRENNLKVGREMLNKELVHLNQPTLDPQLSVLKNYLGRDTSFKDREFVLESIGNGHYSVKDVLRKILPPDVLVDSKNSTVRFKEVDLHRLENEAILISGETNIPVEFASCCTPQFGAPIVGYVGKNHTIKIHENTCDELENLDKNRFIEASFADARGYFVTLELHTSDDPEVSSVIWEKLKMFSLAVRELSTMEKRDDGIVRRLYMKVADSDQLFDIIARLENVDGVYSIRKIPAYSS